MKDILSDGNVFIISIVAGFVFCAVFASFNSQPWDSPYGWIVISVMGACLGFLGKGSPWLWGLGIYFGETIFGCGSFLKSMFFYSGGGVNMFIPLGIVFLIPFTLPAFIGSLAGFGLRKVLNNMLNTDARKPRAD